MKRSFNKCAVFLALLLMCQYVSASHIVKRDDNNPGMMDTIKNLTNGLPLIGGTISNLIQMLQDLYNKIQELTNGALGRILGGALPCTIDLDAHFTCTGVTAQSSLSDLIRQLLDPVPSLVLPGFVKNLIYLAVDAFVIPTIDTLLGGVPMSS